jgi:hypothetical protein
MLVHYKKNKKPGRSFLLPKHRKEPFALPWSGRCKNPLIRCVFSFLIFTITFDTVLGSMTKYGMQHIK